MKKEISVFFEEGKYHYCIGGYQVEFLEIINLLNNTTPKTKGECICVCKIYVKDDNWLSETKGKCTFENPICVCEIYLNDDTDGEEGNSSFLSIGLKLIEYKREIIKTDKDITVSVNKDENNNYTYNIVSNLQTHKNILCNNILSILLEVIEGIIFQAHPKQDEELPPARAIEEVASSTPDFVEGARDIDECAREVAEAFSSAGFKV